MVFIKKSIVNKFAVLSSYGKKEIDGIISGTGKLDCPE